MCGTGKMKYGRDYHYYVCNNCHYCVRSVTLEERVMNALREYLSEDRVTTLAGAAYAEYTKEQIIPIMGCTRAYQPGAEAAFKANNGFEVEYVMRSTPVLNSYGIAATMTALNSKTRFPEKSVEFLADIWYH